jgi:hypothetical protein
MSLFEFHIDPLRWLFLGYFKSKLNKINNKPYFTFWRRLFEKTKIKRRIYGFAIPGVVTSMPK